MSCSVPQVSPSLVSALRTCELVFAFSVQAGLDGEPPALHSCVGGAAILAGCLALAGDRATTPSLTRPPHQEQTPLLSNSP